MKSVKDAKFIVELIFVIYVVFRTAFQIKVK